LEQSKILKFKAFSVNVSDIHPQQELHLTCIGVVMIATKSNNSTQTFTTTQNFL